MSWRKKNIRTDHDNYDLANGPKNPSFRQCQVAKPERQEQTWQERRAWQEKRKHKKQKLNRERLARLKAERRRARRSDRARAVVDGLLKQLASERRRREAEMKTMSELFGVSS